MKEIFKT